MIYFVRHGESEANQRKIFAGQGVDCILTDKGREEALQTAREIIAEGIQIDRIISSPLIRAVETAHIIAKELGFDILKITKDQRIIEYDLGSLSGTPWNPIINLAEAEGSEDTNVFKDRILFCIKDISSQSGNTLLVSHGIVARMLKTIKDGNDPETFNEMPTLANASVFKIDWLE